MLVNIFLTVLEMSVTASIAAVIVILLRQLAGRKLPVRFIYLAWAIVLIRLLLPFSIQSDFSLFNIIKLPVAATESSTFKDIVKPEDQGRETNTGITFGAGDSADENTYIKNNDNAGNSNNTESIIEEEVRQSGKTEPVFVMACIWISVSLSLLACFIYAYIKTTGRFKTAVLYNNDSLLKEAADKLRLKRKVSIYLSDLIDTPVVSGIANVRIIIPEVLAADCCSKELEYVITHELVHIKRFDNITKLLAVMSLCLHWFNPLVWLCFLLYQKDMEMSCDARVLAAYDNDIRTEYANLLLNIAVKQNTHFYGTVIAFGESSLKGRIKGILKFNKNKVWPGIIAVLLLAVISITLLTNGRFDNFAKTKSTVIDSDTLNKLLEHRSRYIGDASNAVNLLYKLPYGSKMEGIELETKGKPYRIIINYRLDDNDASNEEADILNDVKPTLLDNALIIFSLIENVDIVKFNILPLNKTVQYERTELQQHFDRDLWEYSSSKEDFDKFLLDIYFEIFIYPEKYSLAMSSVPGMRITIALNVEYFDTADRVKYVTENGSLLTRNVTTGQITNHGESLMTEFEPIYWAPYDMDENLRDNVVTISVLNKKGDIIISKRIRIERVDNSSFTVKASYDIM